jgi:hypothetical protein
MKTDKTIYQIAQIALDSDSMRGQIQDELQLGDQEIMELYKYLNKIVPKFEKLGH